VERFCFVVPMILQNNGYLQTSGEKLNLNA
jgi:hypothetical protein